MLDGIIIKALSGFYYVSTESGIIECHARGLFRKKCDSPLVGDRVKVEALADGSGTVTEIYDRKNFLLRPPIANIDKIFIVSAYETPAPNTLVIDTMTAIAEDKGIEPVIVFNKCDLGDFSELEAVYKSCGYTVITTSSSVGVGIDEIRQEAQGCVSVFAGNTGVGKSSLLNAAFDGLALKTGAVSEKLGRGRHTTRHVELFGVSDNGYVADTPGFSSLTLSDADFLHKENLQFAFREFDDYIGGCRFSSCAHIGEVGCAVFSALAEGKISQSRYESYKRLYSELSKQNEWEKKNTSRKR